MDATQFRDIDRQLKRAIDADIMDRVYEGGPVAQPKHTTLQTTLPLDSAERKRVPLYSGPLRLFPAALAEVAKVIQVGNDKHCPGGELQHVRWKSNDHADCIVRHLVDLSEDYGFGVGRDENGVPQVAYIAWRALALCQEWAEQNLGAPLAPAALTKESAEDEQQFQTLTNSPGAADFLASYPSQHDMEALGRAADRAVFRALELGDPSVVDHEG